MTVLPVPLSLLSVDQEDAAGQDARGTSCLTVVAGSLHPQRVEQVHTNVCTAHCAETSDRILQHREHTQAATLDEPLQDEEQLGCLLQWSHARNTH